MIFLVARRIVVSALILLVARCDEDRNANSCSLKDEQIR
jgi:hypothetical protein